MERIIGRWRQTTIDMENLRGYAQGMTFCPEHILLARIREGDDSGFEALVAAHSGRVLALAWRLVGNRHDAEDIAQEAFLRLHRGVSGFRGDSSVSTWMYRTVTRLAIDHLRRQKLKEAVFFLRRSNEEDDPLDIAPDTGASPGDRLLARQIGQRLSAALKRLSPRQKAVFILRHHEGLSLPEIARVLELEEGTVKAHLFRAVRTLRNELKDLYTEIV